MVQLQNYTQIGTENMRLFRSYRNILEQFYRLLIDPKILQKCVDAE